jgi:hypothetical protein
MTFKDCVLCKGQTPGLFSPRHLKGAQVCCEYATSNVQAQRRTAESSRCLKPEVSFTNDPSAGSPTERFVTYRVLLPDLSAGARPYLKHLHHADTHYHLACELHPYPSLDLELGCGLSLFFTLLPSPRSLPWCCTLSFDEPR